MNTQSINFDELISMIKANLNEWFQFPREKLFCQVATLMSGKPKLRTMVLYDFTPQGSLVFITDTNSQKWAQLVECKEISVCLLNHDIAQILVEGSALLHTYQSNPPMATLYWQEYLDQYWRDFYKESEAPKTLDPIPSSFGIVEIIPKEWEVLHINTEDYLSGSKTFYENKGNYWAQQLRPLL
ncbi:MAG: pyridoxamine 5'-phosphate oxidase family protein [Tatlockia sp.]|nr:pyridoxamine 5'-phosphate oxidase family protein [Tatlockia sp.]